MFPKAKEVSFVISDLHLGEGAQSSLEEFKHHPAGLDICDTGLDHVLDEAFCDFINCIVNDYRGAKICLKLLGDTFDPLAVELDGKAEVLLYEEDDLRKFRAIANGHPRFFSALRLFCLQPDCFLQVFVGNHDLFLAWPEVQKEFLGMVSPGQFEKVKFMYSLDEMGVYYEHGATEPHDRFDPKKLIIRQADLLELLKKENLENLLHSGQIPLRETLNVTQGHYLSVGLSNALKKANYLIGRMHIHGFVWKDAAMRIFRRSWYRRRSFVLVAAFNLIKTFIVHSLFNLWHMRTKSGFIKILKVIWWTITGAIDGTTPRAHAARLLRERDDIDIVVLGHEHWPEEELYRVGNRHKKYFNTGSWTEMWECRALSPNKVWKRLPRLQRFLLFFRELFRDADLVSTTLFPVLVVSYDEEGERWVRLRRWDSESKEIKDFI